MAATVTGQPHKCLLTGGMGPRLHTEGFQFTLLQATPLH